MANILVVSPTGALINGAERAGLSLMGNLTASDFRVLNAFPAHYQRHVPHQFVTYRESMAAIGAEALPLDFGWWVPGDDQHGRRELTAVAELISAIQTHDIDIVVTNTSNFPWGALAATLTGRPHAWLLHEFPTGAFAWLEDKYDFIAEFSDAVFCASPSLQREVRDRVAQIGQAVVLESFRPYSDVSSISLADPQEPRLIVVGSVNRRKNQLDAVRALAELRDFGISPNLVFFGAIEDEEYYEEILVAAQEFGIAQQLTFLGHQEDPWTMVSPHDIVVQPSVTEVFSLVACEAVQLGLRLILSSNPSSSDISDTVGGLSIYESGDVRALAAQIERMLRDPAASLYEAVQAQQTASIALSMESCHAPILTFLTATVTDKRWNSIQHITPYLVGAMSETSREIASLRDAVHESSLRLQALEADRNARKMAEGILRHELAAVYASRTWRLGYALAAPLRLFRRFGRRRRPAV